MPEAPLQLIGPPFGEGNGRACYHHPERLDRCIKVAKPGRSPRQLRREDVWYKRFKPLLRYDQNLRDMQSYRQMERRGLPKTGYQFAVVDGFVETNLGPGLSMELYRDPDGEVCPSLRDWVLEHGCSERLDRALHEMIEAHVRHAVLIYDPFPGNVVVQEQPDGSLRTYYIDGLGAGIVMPFIHFSQDVAARRLRKKHEKLIRGVRRRAAMREQRLAEEALGQGS